MAHDEEPPKRTVAQVSKPEFWNGEYQDDGDEPSIPDFLLEAEIAELAPGRALDLGCGRGHNAAMLARRGWTVHGVDWAETAIEAARRTATAEGLRATFEVADVTTWRPRQTCDLVINTYALWEGETGEATLRNVARAVAPGGTAIVIEWAQQMADEWQWQDSPSYFPSHETVASALAELEIECAETRCITGVLSEPADPRRTESGIAYIVFVRARRLTVAHPCSGM